MSQDQLVVLAMVGAQVLPNEELRLTEKFVDGMQEYARLWPSDNIKAVMPEQIEDDDNLDSKTYRQADLAFEVQAIDFDDKNQIKNALLDASVVLGGASHWLNGIADFCLEREIGYVFCSEYSRNTRFQIIRANTTNPILRLRRYVWEFNQERANRKEVSLARAVQCNGTPTYETYKALNSNTILYFDNRISPELLMQEQNLQPLPDKFDDNNRIQLAFSGRLNPMKGAEELIKVAEALTQLGVAFDLHVYGSGVSEPTMKAEIVRLGLEDNVHMHGVLDFTTELCPTLKRDIDLFVCCHIQGDPSCTYIETFACGVPIVGYNNEAFQGILERTTSGWGVPMHDVQGMAAKIAEICAQPSLLDNPRRQGLTFAIENAFEPTQKLRIGQMAQLL